MGKCKVTPKLLHDFPSFRKADNQHVKCIYDNGIISIANGLHSARQHVISALHKAATPSEIQPTYLKCVNSANDTQSGIKKARILHVLKIVSDGNSFRSSDSASHKQRIYSRMFPDSTFSNIKCGRTKVNSILFQLYIVFPS